jgi:hypothetical protein
MNTRSAWSSAASCRSAFRCTGTRIRPRRPSLQPWREMPPDQMPWRTHHTEATQDAHARSLQRRHVAGVDIESRPTAPLRPAIRHWRGTGCPTRRRRARVSIGSTTQSPPLHDRCRQPPSRHFGRSPDRSNRFGNAVSERVNVAAIRWTGIRVSRTVGTRCRFGRRCPARFAYNRISLLFG